MSEYRRFHFFTCFIEKKSKTENGEFQPIVAVTKN